MAFSKAHFFSQSDYHFSLVCHALSHPARIAIIRKLHEHQKLSVADLKKGIPLSKSAFSQHLKILRDMHIVGCEEQYPTIWYWINPNLPDTQSAIVDMVLRIGEYFPKIDPVELTSVGRRRGTLQPI